MSPGECLPEEDADRPDIGGPAGLLAGEPLGGDVRERSRDVPDRRERVGVLELGEPEVEQPDRDLVALLEHDVRGLHVAVDDALRVRVRERLEHLRGGLDRRPVVQHAAAKRLAQRAPGNVRVGDVDVALVAGERQRAQAARMPEPGGGVDLTLGARAGLALARDDLQRDVAAFVLVAGQPDRAPAAAAQGPERPIPAEDEMVLGDRDRWLHRR